MIIVLTENNDNVTNANISNTETGAIPVQSPYIAAIQIDDMDASVKYDKINANGDLQGYSLDALFKDTQNYDNLKKIYQLSAYYVNEDNIYGGAIKNVLVNFSVTNYRLQGATESSRKFFYEWLNKINFNTLLYGIYYDLYVYGNVYLYVRDDCSVQVLPPHRIKCSALSLSGEPIIGYVHPTTQTYEANAVDIKELELQYAGLPDEVIEGKKRGERVTTLNPERTYYIGLNKSYWERYAMPLCINILSCFSRKNLIVETEDIELANMAKSLLHVKVGDKDLRPTPNRHELTDVSKSFVTAITQRDRNLAVTAWDVKAEWLNCSQRETSELITKKLSWVNSEILSGIGLSPIIVCGSDYSYNGSSGNFAQVTANVAIANKRINQAISSVERIFKKIMELVAVVYNIKKVPDLVFDSCDLSTDKEAQDTILSLFDKGLVGYQTAFERLGLNYNQEKERRKQESKDNDAETFFPPAQSYNTSITPNSGRPPLSNEERTSDPISSKSNDIPSPSDK